METIIERTFVFLNNRYWVIRTREIEENVFRTEIYPKREPIDKCAYLPFHTIEFNNIDDVQFNHWLVVDLLRAVNTWM